MGLSRYDPTIKRDPYSIDIIDIIGGLLLTTSLLLFLAIIIYLIITGQ